MMKLTKLFMACLICFGISISNTIAETAKPAFIDLGLTEKELGYKDRSVTVPVDLEKVPNNPRIDLSFKVIEASTCQDTYSATELLVNGRNVTDIDFTELNEGENQAISVPIPKNMLVVGRNEVTIITGSCQKALDAMQFNNLRLYQ